MEYLSFILFIVLSILAIVLLSCIVIVTINDIRTDSDRLKQIQKERNNISMSL